MKNGESTYYTDLVKNVHEIMMKDDYIKNIKHNDLKKLDHNIMFLENDVVSYYPFSDFLSANGYLEIIEDKETERVYLQFNMHQPTPDELEALKEDDRLQSHAILSVLEGYFKNNKKNLEYALDNLNKQESYGVKLKHHQYVDSDKYTSYHDMQITLDNAITPEEMVKVIKTILPYLLINWKLPELLLNVELPGEFFRK